MHNLRIYNRVTILHVTVGDKEILRRRDEASEERSRRGEPLMVQRNMISLGEMRLANSSHANMNIYLPPRRFHGGKLGSSHISLEVWKKQLAGFNAQFHSMDWT